jgi:hypothetical protein
MVNGEPILTNSSIERSIESVKHTEGNITGLTIHEFLALPSRARVGVCYSGEYEGEGFICLKKL